MRNPTATMAWGETGRQSTGTDYEDAELIADILRPWLAGKPSGKPVFPLRGKAVNVLKPDRAARSACVLMRETQF